MRNDEKLSVIELGDTDLMSRLVSDLFEGIINEIKIKEIA